MKKFTALIVLFLFCGVQLIFAQQKITGTVTNSENGSAIPGVTVRAEGTTIGTVTDLEGKYELSVPDGTQKLIFSYVGMISKTITIDKTVINVSLTPDTKNLDEFVITALGISREKKALGYSVQGVSSEELTKANESNVINSLTGKVSGIQITNATGAVGSSSRIVIRGASSFENNQPLFVVDGVPISNATTEVSQWGSTDFGNAAMDIDPANIASISVLKGPNAAALYGSRGSNGVVLITTKKGMEGKKKNAIGVSITSSISVQDPYVFVKYQDQYGQGVLGSEFYYNRYARKTGMPYSEFAVGGYHPGIGFTYFDGAGGGVNDGVDESWGPRLDIGLKIPQYNSPLTDPTDPTTREATPWVSHPSNIEDFFENGITFDNNVAIYKRTDVSNVRLSVSRQDVSGTVPNTDLTKNTVNFSGGMSLTDKLHTSATVTYIQNKSDNLPGQGYGPNNVMQSLGGWFGRQVNMEDMKNHYDEMNIFGNPYSWNTNYHNNPYWTVYKNTTSRGRHRMFGNFQMSYDILPWLSLTGRMGTDFYHEYRKHVDYNQSIDYPNGHFWQNERQEVEINGDLFFTINKKFNNFSLYGITGLNNRSNNYQYSYLEAPELTVPNKFFISNVKGNPAAGMRETHKKVIGTYAQASLGWKGMLYLDLTARNEWSSSLPAENRSYFYPSATLSYILTETIDVNPAFLSYAKIRGGWAQVGSDTDPHRLQGVYEGLDPFRGVTLFRTTRTLPPIGLMPEITSSFEVGADLRFIHNRIALDFTWYRQITKNQIMSINISDAAGYDYALINAGQVTNKGIEVTLTGKVIENKNGFNYTALVNWSKNDNTVDELYGDLKSYELSSSWGGVTVEARPGEPMGVIRANGFVRDQDNKVVVGPDGKPIVAETPIVVGNTTADWMGSINNLFAYKNITFSALIGCKMGGDIFSVSDWFGAYAGVTAETAQDGIRENGVLYNGVKGVFDDNGNLIMDENGVAITNGEPNDIVTSAQSFYSGYWGREEYSIIDGSYIKLREVTLGYVFDKEMLRNINWLQSVSLSLVCRNAAILWRHPSNDLGIDPETGFGATMRGVGLEQYQIPTARTFGFKLNATF
ncbi:MAG: SusC/RagA family TonB-linked outer membrane protein [Bacteroidetes bacterium]|nr:MAG: SusC/RagA family TonB-linked outer membrane protein [Bacteroidota bacterium]